MNREIYLTVLLLGATTLFAEESMPDPAKLQAQMEKIRPIHAVLGKPQPGDWLTQHHEDGQSFEKYIASDPITPRGKRSIVYIQPLGEFTPGLRKIVTLAADFIGRYFNVSVKVKDDLPLSIIPPKARRTHPTWHVKQILTDYVLEDVLEPHLPDDAAAYIAFTSSDLWPGEGWNFVFGQASLRNRVGVWSIYRNGDPDQDAESFRLCLLRTLKTATHECGHMFSIEHCTKYECNMCGSNNQEESDRRTLELCPECVAKVWWATGADPMGRYSSLAKFCKENGLAAQEEIYLKLMNALK